MIRRGLKFLLERWEQLWKSIEGPELEPPFWHSHFLSYYNAKKSFIVLDFDFMEGLSTSVPDQAKVPDT